MAIEDNLLKQIEKVRAKRAERKIRERKALNRKTTNRRMTRLAYTKYIHEAIKEGLVERITTVGSKNTIYFKSGVVMNIMILRDGGYFSAKCFCDIMNDFKKIDLRKLKPAEQCDTRVNFGDGKTKLNSCEMIQIDINRCYFNVSHILGFITDAHYEKYNEKKFKFSTNVAVGCTQREKVSTTYKNGKVYMERKQNPMRRIRANILDYVATLYKEVSEQYDIAYFHTDCFYIKKQNPETDKANIEGIFSIIEKYGLTAKIEEQIEEQIEENIEEKPIEKV